MAAEFIPTTKQVRDGYAEDPEDDYRNPINAPANFRAAQQAFDRWLAKHDAEVGVRIVTTTEELDALPLDAVVVDFAGCPRTKRAGDLVMSGGWTNAGRSPLTAHQLANGRPMRVVYEGRARSGEAK